MELDLRTLFFTLTAVELVLAVVLLLFWKTQAALPGIAHFTIGTSLGALGGLLIGFRGPIPVPVSVVGNNLCFVVAILLALRAYQSALGKSGRPVFEIAIVVLMAAGITYFTFVDFDAAARVAISALIYSAIGFVGAFDLSRERQPDIRVACFSVFLLFAIYATTQLIVAITTFSAGTDPSYLDTRNAILAFSLLVTIAAAIGWTLGFLWLAYSISQARLRKTEKLDAVGRLAGGIAHELNNVLTPISGLSATVLEEMPAEDPRRKRLELVVKASNRAAELVRGILTFGQRQDAMVPEKIDIAAVVRGSIAELRSGFPSGLSVTEDLDDATGPVVADAGYVRIVLENLTTNSLDAMEGIPGRLRISLTPVEIGPKRTPGALDLVPGGYAKLTVADNGHGMNESTLSHAIDPFFTTRTVGKGVGLGLSVVNGIVAMSGGALNISSIPGLGTTVDVYLPLAGE